MERPVSGTCGKHADWICCPISDKLYKSGWDSNYKLETGFSVGNIQATHTPLTLMLREYPWLVCSDMRIRKVPRRFPRAINSFSASLRAILPKYQLQGMTGKCGMHIQMNVQSYYKELKQFSLYFGHGPEAGNIWQLPLGIHSLPTSIKLFNLRFHSSACK